MKRLLEMKPISWLRNGYDYIDNRMETYPAPVQFLLSIIIYLPIALFVVFVIVPVLMMYFVALFTYLGLKWFFEKVMDVYVPPWVDLNRDFEGHPHIHQEMTCSECGTLLKKLYHECPECGVNFKNTSDRFFMD